MEGRTRSTADGRRRPGFWDLKLAVAATAAADGGRDHGFSEFTVLQRGRCGSHSTSAQGRYPMEHAPEKWRRAYQDDGFVIVPDVLDSALVTRLRDGMDRITGG